MNPDPPLPSNRPSPFTRRHGLALLLSATALALVGCVGAPAEPVRRATRSAPAPRALAVPTIRPKGPAPAVVGKSVLVLDARTGKVLHSKSADTRRAIASTQKLLTALVAIEAGGLDRRITVAKSDTWVEPSKLYLRAGDSYKKSDLVAALLVKSGNDVARCLARNHAGSESAFATAMNSKARRLGMLNSNFKNPHGLTSSGQYSTARDLGKLAMAAYRNRTIRSITAIKKLPFRFADGRTVTFTNTNKVLARSPYCNGMKTGYTRASGRCLVSSGKKGTREVIVIVLGSTSQSIWRDSHKLLDWALGV